MLIAAVLLIKAFIPTGWMPAYAAGTVTLQLCGGWTVVAADSPEAELHKIAVAAGRAEQHPDDQPDHDPGTSMDSPCSFAALGLAYTPIDLTADPIAPIPTAPSATSPADTVLVGRGLAAPPPPQTGPPSLS